MPGFFIFFNYLLTAWLKTNERHVKRQKKKKPRGGGGQITKSSRDTGGQRGVDESKKFEHTQAHTEMKK